MENELVAELNYESGSDESDCEEGSTGSGVKGQGSRDSNALLDTWLKELDSLSTDMDPRPVDPFRFSQATLEDTQEDELNAILGELSALQLSLDREIKQGITNNSSNLNKPPASENGARTESPDNDSGFSDNASLLSSGSSALSGAGSSSGSSTTSCPTANKTIPQTNVLHASELLDLVGARVQHQLNSVGQLIPDEKAEKIRVALAKMRAASVTRLYVKAFSSDGSSKALMVDESMSCGRVLALLADKNHVPLSPKWALVEHIPHLHMERVYEDHENMVENLLMWTRDSKNKIFFVERDDKYDAFANPQRYFLGCEGHQGQNMDEHTKGSLLEEFFSAGLGVPEVESYLYLKAEGKKAWKKFLFVLRASGIYYYPKGKGASKDLLCLAPIDHNQQAYQGIGWKKKFKAPTEHGFVIKPPRLQVKSHRHIKYLCAEEPETLRKWMTGLRIAKYGKQLWENYRTLLEDLAHEDLDRFGRSVSLACMPQPQPTNNSNSNNTNIQIVSKPMQNGGLATLEHPTLPPPPTPPREEGFESDAPVGGTIKRKPSAGLIPKLPLTLNTRSIVSEFIQQQSLNQNQGPIPEVNTLQRKRSLSGASNSSSNSSIASQIQIRPPPPPTLVEEVIDYESLPPPPPELLQEIAPPQISKIPPIPPEKPLSGKKTVSFVTPSPAPSSPNKLESPPAAFLTDLQRVMQKKWQVAQKCAASERPTSPAEILGFKFQQNDAPLSNTNESPSHVQAWVSQHYGGLPMGELREVNPAPSSPNHNLKSKPPAPARSSTSSLTYATPSVNLNLPPPPPVQNYNQIQLAAQGPLIIYENFQGRKKSGGTNFEYDAVHLRNKKPPPPVPKRADSTHLSAHIVYN